MPKPIAHRPRYSRSRTSIRKRRSAPRATCVCPRIVQSLALVAEVVHGAPSRFSDPARFAFAHGGKDGHPHPVPLKTYDESLGFLRKSLDAAKVGHTDKLDGFRRLDRFVRMVETQREPLADLDALIRHEN